MAAAMTPESREIDLAPYEGKSIKVEGHLSGGWIYSARIVEGGESVGEDKPGVTEDRSQEPDDDTPHQVDDNQPSACVEGETQEATLAQLSSAGVSSSAVDAELKDVGATMAQVSSGDVFIQAGHFNPHSWDNNTGASGPRGNEIDWTPIVTDEATRVLQAHGVSVIKADARIKGSSRRFNVNVAVFVHFDGSANPNAGGASVGYNDDTDRAAAHEWKALYSRYWPSAFGWHADNYTNALRGYYGFSNTVTQDAEFVIEFGTLSNRREADWLQPRLRWLGRLLAHFLSHRIKKGNVPDPGPFAG
jgi:N-acetylmuramoyl-L-alanine amidase